MKWINLIALFLLTSIFSVAHANEERVQIGDLIQVNLPGESSLNKGFQVDKRGRITLPEVGALYVAGYSEAQLEQVVKESLEKVYRDLSSASVYIAEQQILVSVQGYVTSPGEYTLSKSSDVQMAIHAAGGLRSGAQLNSLFIKRGKDKITFNYKTFLDTGDESLLPELVSLDTIFVPASPLVGNIEQEFDANKLANAGDSADGRTAIKVFGEVNAPGSFSFKANSDLVDIIMRAGGVTRYASVEQIRVISDNTPKLFNLKTYLDSGDISLLPPLTPGTTIFVPKQEEEIKAGANVVYIMGEVASPGAYEGKKNASFMDILANAGGPTRYAESRQIRVIKSNGQVIKFDLTAFTEGLTRKSPPKIGPGDAIFVPEKTDMNEKSWLKIAPNRAVSVIGEVVRPGRVEWSDEMDLMDLLSHVGGPTLRADTSKIEVVAADNQLHIFDLDDFILKGAPNSELPNISAGAIVRVHDLPQDPSDNKSQWVRQSSDASIYVFGQVNAPGRYRFTKDMHFLDILSAADGPTKDADIHNIRITHRDKSYSKVSKLNLSLYFETGDESLLPNVTMGDTIYIPEKDKIWLDRSKESTVRVLGAVNNPGRYVFDDNMTLLDLLAEAGGPSDRAYLEKISIVNMSCCQGQARTFDLVDFSKTANIYKLPVLRAGDTIYVPDRNESIIEKARVGLEDILRLTTTIVLIGAL
ncbi:SLBB domain-containing protein [Vibrio natriegens]|jgi:protein involved in polysaccharide export with SLBB domain|uniref:Sugar ABC transporter substrate-binding protein n=1 Tax=Vibrio natriegens NBRC 15636 = ATCC 14048 = DSM 759 TaxID=1219067 RepID=A0AAN0Y2X0_VIBNA|nr:SLBB domain-containing protein [Vibrio natriegens]ALR15305.1 sugar ABC transporter substrate-binding protein [Vibrio natriegens NBRC 15636 = ATCC 14048 = DSM 759]ANQ12836.1 sugar ABC transporter substrate-binding protein [Vibrio natriegens NBRC 15636 = ATCC 14048 = DSM 759]EPM40951.1 sugar ABC transporter substrate-binding protein [Vibrio natriegens NBRC 15636 = ATCC 14048 = DSM 759]MDX6027240.1 SLBB domain-containing protein [Vibrio natriegens NBRC 15636 = ATCC 14048 = DSM 759]UUI10565.1 S